MARINNYIKDDIVEPTDIVIGTEQSTGKTKNYSIDSIRNFFVTETNVGGIIFKKGSHLVSGEFTANSNYFSGLTEFKFNMIDSKGDSITPIFSALKISLPTNGFVIKVEDSAKQNKFILAKILNIIDGGTFFTITLDAIKNVGAGELVIGNNFSLEVGLYTDTTSGVEWSNLLNKPTTFTPSAHNHIISDTIGLQAALDERFVSAEEKAAITHINRPALNLVSGINTGDQDLSGYELLSNKVISLSGTSTNVQYPSAKLTFDQLALKEDVFSKNTAFNKNYSTLATDIKVNGVQSLGVLDTLPRADHIHPIDTSREAVVNKQNSLAIDGSGTKYPTVDAIRASNIPAESLNGSTFKTVQHIQDLFHSAGWTSGGVITNAGGGVITVSSGTGLIRATNSDIATIFFTDFAASIPANVVLVDGSQNYIYVEYNAGAPRVIATTIERADYNTSFLIGNVYRVGTTLHINSTTKTAISDHAAKMITFNKEVMPYARANGSMISEVATRGFAITAGTFWNGLVRFTTNAFSTATGSFFYFYRNGVGGWTKVATQTQINNTQFDNGTGTLATLSNNKYGVHWVFIDTDGDTYVVYGQGDYTLIEAQNAMVPSSLPVEVTSHAFVVGKIIIQKSATAFTQIESAFAMGFTTAMASEHNSLAGLDTGNYLHLTEAQKTIATQSATNTLSGFVNAGSQTFGGEKTFTLSPIVPTPTTNTQATNKSYVDGKVTDIITDGVTTIAPSQNAVFDALALKEDKSNKNIANGYAGLDANLKINPSHLPALAVTDTFVVASQVAMLALVAETGDVAVRTDLNKSFILRGTNPTLLADWQELLTPTDAVQSVFGRSGTVSAQANDYNADQILETATRVFLSPTEKTAITHSNRSALDLVSGTNTGDNAINNLYSGLVSNATHTGDVTGATALTIATDAVTNTKLANMAVNTIKGRITAGTGDPEDLTATQVRTIITDADNRFVSDAEKTTWNAKQPQLNGTGFVKASGAIISYDNTTYQPLLTNPITGTLITNKIPKASGTGTLTDSVISESGGNVGIGTVSPKGIVHCGISNSDVTPFLATGGSSYGWGMFYENTFGNLWISRHEADIYIPAITIARNNGNVIIGTTTDNGAKLQVNGSATFASTVTATDFIGSSDERLKENIAVLVPKKINSVYKSFNMIGDEQVRVGVVAQDLEVEHPEFVRTNEDGMKSVSYSDLHSAEIAYLKDKIDRLEELVNKLMK